MQKPETFKTPQDISEIVVDFLSFIQDVKTFKNSKLASYPEILDIYKRKEFDINQQPTLWQTMIYSVRKFSQKPFDTGREVLQCFILIIFCPYFTPKILNKMMRSKPKQSFLSEGPPSKVIKPKNLKYIRTSNEILYDAVFKELNLKKPWVISQWIVQNKEEIKKNQSDQIDKQELQAVIQLIQNCKNILIFQFVLSLAGIITLMNSKNHNYCTPPKLSLKSMIIHDELSRSNLSRFERKIQRQLKYKILFDFTSSFTIETKVRSKRSHYLIIIVLMSLNLPFEQIKIDEYFHLLHKLAEKDKRITFAKMIQSKCSFCNFQAFSSRSIQKTRMYQCLNRKFLVAANDKSYQPLQNSIVSERKEIQAGKTFFASEQEIDL